MCGINGFNFQNRKIIEDMNDSIKHRGPDDSGVYSSKDLSLGQRRLSIIDISKKASQPMIFIHKGKKAIIVFNGEIYNFLEIKGELIKKGYTFKNKSDTEVILASYFEWGEDCVKHFNGMWAFCIYDLQKKILFLSRDRLGQKPIYYFHKKGKFIFSSEIKGILKHKVPKDFSQEAIDLYFTLGFIPAPYSIYKNINKLEARQSLIFDLRKKKIKKYYYYQYPKYNPEKNKKKLISEGKKLLEDAVKKRLIADVPLGAFLSGGLDSSSIVYFMQKNMRQKVNTFSIGFEGKYDESKEAKLVSNKFKTKHHHKYFAEKDFKKLLPKIFYYYDEPFADPSMFPMLFLSKFAREKLTVAISGDGGDEIFGGYPRHIKGRQLALLKKTPSLFRKLLLQLIPKSFPDKGLREGLRLSLLNKDEIHSEVREDVYKPKIYKKLVQNKLRECLKLSKGNLAEAIILLDRYFSTLGDHFLVKVDRASMAASLEVRSPFLDYRMIEFASRIPVEYKTSLKQSKVLFRKMMKGILPKAVLTKKKQGFTPPIEKWILKPTYKKELEKAVKELTSKGILSKEWEEFFKNKVFKDKNKFFRLHKIRLYLFYQWFKYWHE